MRNLIIFLTGAFGYGILELLWRGHTHWTMGILGGICLIILYKANIALSEKGLLYKGICFALLITSAELIAGIIINLIFKLDVWDYSNQPLNVYGQICPLYSAFWFLLSYPISCICNQLYKTLKNPVL